MKQTGRGSAAFAARKRVRSSTGTQRMVRRKDAPLSPKERRRLLQLVACGSVFVLLVAVKLLLPSKMSSIGEQLSGILRQNMDIQAVFSAVGQAAAGETDAQGMLGEVYQAVFAPQESTEVMQTATVQVQDPRFMESSAIESLRQFQKEQTEEPQQESESSAAEGTGGVEASNLAYVLYSDQNLPENVSLEQAILGFDYCTPLAGCLSSNFGYREHPTEGEERFHYGVDLAAEEGTAISCFADGTVKAVGESSSYGKYVIVSHQSGYDTLYAHCSKITVSSGTEIKEGETIAKVGSTGMATGPHLHFELHRDGVYLNPIYYVTTI